MRHVGSLVLTLLCISSHAGAQTVLDFSTIPHGIEVVGEHVGEWDIPDGFGGFHWLGFRAGDSHYTASNFGFFFDRGYAFAGAYAEFYASNPFRLFSFYAGADRDPYEVTRVDGYLDGSLVQSTYFGLPKTFSDTDAYVPEFHAFDGWLVDRVAFTTSGPLESKLGLSRITVATTPEPMSIALLATGLVGLGAVGWRRRRQGVA